MAAVGISVTSALIILLTGGFRLASPVRIIATDSSRPLLLGAVLGALYVARRHAQWRSDLETVFAWRWPRAIAWLCVVAAFGYAVGWGTFKAAGPDQSGYVSEADGWARGALTWAPPEWARHGDWVNAVGSSAPVGYKPTVAGDRIAPIYSPGLPLLMAAFELVGDGDAPYPRRFLRRNRQAAQRLPSARRSNQTIGIRRRSRQVA